jgi:hypothetical protein
MPHSDGLGPHLYQAVSPKEDLEAGPTNATTLLNYDPLQAKTEPLQTRKHVTVARMKSSYAYLEMGILFHMEVLLVNDHAVANIIGVNYVFMFHWALRKVITFSNTMVRHTGWL